MYVELETFSLEFAPTTLRLALLIYSLQFSSLLFLYVAGRSGFPRFSLSLSAEKWKLYSCELELWHTTLT